MKIPSWVICDFSLCMLSIYLWLIYYLFDSQPYHCICVLPFTFFCVSIVLNSNYFFKLLLCPSNTYTGVSEHPQEPQVRWRSLPFFTNYIHSWDYVWYLYMGHPIEENQHVSSFFKKTFKKWIKKPVALLAKEKRPRMIGEMMTLRHSSSFIHFI